MDSTENVSSSSFTINFIEIYRSYPCLWKLKSPDYLNRLKRDQAYKSLIEFSQKANRNADINFVKKKIKNLRDAFRKELRKVSDSEKSGVSTTDVYRPRLWYFDLMLFTIESETSGPSTSGMREPSPILSDDSELDLVDKEVKIISVESLASSPDEKPIISPGEVMIPSAESTSNSENQHIMHPQKVMIPSAESTSNSANQHIMHPQKDLDEPPPQDAAEKEDLPTPRASKVQMSVGNPERIRDHSPKEYRIQMVKRTDDPQPTSTKKEDECDAFAAYVAAKMRTMSREQRLYAEHYLFQVLYKGSMNQLPPPGVVTEPQYPAMMPMTFIPPEMYSHGQGRPGNGTGHYYNTPVMPGPHRNMMQKK